MARPKEFDPDAALERAMELFWTRGYQNTSLRELLGAMRINRWSLYETFGDKQRLFVAALRLYRERWTRLIHAHLAAPGPARAALVGLLREMGRQLFGEQLGRGCLISNSAVELRWLDAESAEVVRQSLGALEESFTRVLARAQKEGELDPARDPRTLARFLIAALAGIRDAAKAGAGPKHIDQLVETLISTL